MFLTRTVLVSVLCLASMGPVWADTPDKAPADNGTAPPPISTVPSNGVIRPHPGATADATIKAPPNVDPEMALPPPGTPGATPLPGHPPGVKVVPK